jgi:hypothetical protein
MHEQRPQQQQQQQPVHHAHPVNLPHPQAQRSGITATASLQVEEDLVILDDALTIEAGEEHLTPVRAPVASPPLAQATATAAPAAPAPKKITFNADSMTRHRHYKRQTHTTGLGACRVKTFHGKLSDQGLEYLDDAINVFLDEHPEIEVKLVQSNVGMFDGKFKDFALVVNVWY